MCNRSKGDGVGEIFEEPSRSPNEQELRERLRVQNGMKNTKGLLLWLVGVAKQANAKFFEDRVMGGNSPTGRSNRAIGLKVGHIMKGAFKPIKDVGGHGFKVIISEPIQSAEKPGHNGNGVPAGRRQRRRGRLGNGEGV